MGGTLDCYQMESKYSPFENNGSAIVMLDGAAGALRLSARVLRRARA